MRITTLLASIGLLLIVSVAQAQSNSIRIVCSDLRGMQDRLQLVQSENQVVFNDAAVWDNRDGCNLISEDITLDNPKFVGWLPSDQWLVPVEMITYIQDSHRYRGWHPVNILSRDRFYFSQTCLSRAQSRNGVTLIGAQLGKGGVSDRLDHNCRWPSENGQSSYETLANQ